MNLKIFNIWHEKIFDELLNNVPWDDRDDIIMYGVNENIPKISLGDLLEYELKIYNPKLQALGFCQTSCLYHVYKNKLYEGLDYIGFCQYDMKFEKDTISDIKNTDAETIFHDLTLSCTKALEDHSTDWDSVFDSYSSFFNEKIKKEDIIDIHLPLLHTFVIPVKMFVRMMDWMSHYIENELIYPTRMSRAEFYERIHGIFLAIECYKNPNIKLKPLKLNHIWPHYHNLVPFVGYKQLV